MERITIGRMTDNDIIVDYPTVSGHHATLTIGEGRMTLTDHSTNGTLVNGVVLHNASTTVHRGDSILFANQYPLDWSRVAGEQTQPGGSSQVNWTPRPVYGNASQGEPPLREVGMSFSEAVGSVFRNYATFSGRARRAEYWYFYLLNFIIAFILEIFMMIFPEYYYDGYWFFFVLLIIWEVVIIIPSFAVCVRRLHDTGRSGWNILWNLIPVIGNIIFLVYTCTEGNRDTNKYGPNPKLR